MSMDDYSNLSFEELAQRKRALDAAYAEQFGLAQAAFLKEMQDKAAALGFDIGMVSANSNAKNVFLIDIFSLGYQGFAGPLRILLYDIIIIASTRGLRPRATAVQSL